MFRDDVDVALNELLEQCQRNARHFRYTADLLDDPAESGLLRRLAGERDALIAQLRYRMEEHGELPGMADVEADTLGELRDRITAGFTQSGRATVLRERIEDEERLAAAAAAGLRLERLSAESRSLVEHIEQAAREGANRLRAAG